MYEPPACGGPASQFGLRGTVRVECVNLSLDEVRAIKKCATGDAAYADRVSLGFAFALARLGEALGEDHDVFHEMNVLEGLASNSSTKEFTQFKHPPLHPFWHKHFSTARHLMRNMGERWGSENPGIASFRQ